MIILYCILQSVKLRKETDIPKFFTMHCSFNILFCPQTNKKAENPSKTFSFSFVHPMRIELISSEPESDILSVELRVRHFINAMQKYK